MYHTQRNNNGWTQWISLPSPIKERQKKEVYWMRDCQRRQQRCYTRRNGRTIKNGDSVLWRRWRQRRRQKGDLLQVLRKLNEDIIKDKTKLTPLLLMRAKNQIPQKYCTPVMFACFVCALLSFCAHEIPENTKPENPGKLSWNTPLIPTAVRILFSMRINPN